MTRHWHNKMRGRKSGFGGKKKHRGSGSKGGKGWGGFRKHKRSFIKKYLPDRYGYKGFHPVGRKEQIIINVEQLAKLAEKEKKKEIDLQALGYTKLLGKGEIKQPVTVKTIAASKAAIEKIEAAGGKITGLEKVEAAESDDSEETKEEE